jgi:hypothetical protein
MLAVNRCGNDGRACEEFPDASIDGRRSSSECAFGANEEALESLRNVDEFRDVKG